MLSSFMPLFWPDFPFSITHFAICWIRVSSLTWAAISSQLISEAFGFLSILPYFNPKISLFSVKLYSSTTLKLLGHIAPVSSLSKQSSGIKLKYNAASVANSLNVYDGWEALIKQFSDLKSTWKTFFSVCCIFSP